MFQDLSDEHIPIPKGIYMNKRLYQRILNKNLLHKTLINTNRVDSNALCESSTCGAHSRILLTYIFHCRGMNMDIYAYYEQCVH